LIVRSSDLTNLPIADNPATPAPIISTFAGGTFPAAEVNGFENLGNSWKASIIALSIYNQSA
jgi:hypothetical protein